MFCPISDVKLSFGAPYWKHVRAVSQRIVSHATEVISRSLLWALNLLRDLIKITKIKKKHMVLFHWFVFIPTPYTWGWMVQSAVSAAGPTLIRSSVKLKLTQLNSESGCSQLQPVSQKTRLCNQITAACTETVAIFQLYIWVKVGSPRRGTGTFTAHISRQNNHNMLRNARTYSERSTFILAWQSQLTHHFMASASHNLSCILVVSCNFT